MDVINTSTVPHLSPFRYPGGKTWLIPRIRQWLRNLATKPLAIIEPFAGGAIVGLTAVFECFVDHALLVEIDPDINAVWEAAGRGLAPELVKRIAHFDVTLPNVTAVLNTPVDNVVDRAFRTIVRNRTQYGGIMAPGARLVKQGEDGRGLKSRWYPATLNKRLMAIHHRRHRILPVCRDGIEFMVRHRNDDVAWFIDPPYMVAGRRLYTHSDVDHEGIFRAASKLRAPFLMTYDNDAVIRGYAMEFGLQVREVAMKNTHHAVMSELLISRDLGWLQN